MRKCVAVSHGGGVEWLLRQSGGQDRHGSVLGADVGRGLYGEAVCLGYALAFQDGCDECGGEAVAGPYGIGNLDLGCRLERHVAGGEYVAAVDAAGEYEHLQVVLPEQYPAFVLEVYAGVAEHAADQNELFVVYLQYVAPLHGVAQNLLVVEALAQVDVEDDECIVGLRHGVEKAVDGAARYHAALCQGAEADCLRVFGQGFEAGGIGDVVPRHVFLDFVLRDAGLVDVDLHGAGGIGYLHDVVVEPFGGEVFQDFLAQRIVAYGTYHAARQSELGYVIGKIGRGSAYFLTFGQHVPQGFAHSYYYVFHGMRIGVNGVIISFLFSAYSRADCRQDLGRAAAGGALCEESFS